MVENPKVGEKYWTIAKTIESSNYNENNPPNEPWYIQVVNVKNGIFYVSYWNKDETVDTDVNCSAYVSQHDLYLDESSAWKDYIEVFQNFIQTLEIQLDDFKSQLENKIREQH